MSANALLLSDASSKLSLSIEKLLSSEPLNIAFTFWFCSLTGRAISIEEQVEQAANRGSGERDFKDIAVLGYAYSSGIRRDIVTESLKSGLDWVTGRGPTINGVPAGFCSNSIALLGIAVGVKSLDDKPLLLKAGKWISTFIVQGQSARMPEWHQPLFAATASILQTNLIEISSNAATADVRVALRGLGALPPLTGKERESEEHAALLQIVNPQVPDDQLRAPASSAALQLILQQLPTITLARPSISEVIKLLERVEPSLRRWTWEAKSRTKGGQARQWHIDNEYHVQNLLWMILSPVFPDLLDEVYSESFGQLHPRIDLCIPSLKLVIEVKFVRGDAKFAKVIEEISADCGVYLSRPGEYQHIIPFIWDDSSRVQEHDFLRTGLRKLNGVVDAVVVSRPSSFTVSGNL